MKKWLIFQFVFLNIWKSSLQFLFRCVQVAVKQINDMDKSTSSEKDMAWHGLTPDAWPSDLPFSSGLVSTFRPPEPRKQ